MLIEERQVVRRDVREQQVDLLLPIRELLLQGRDPGVSFGRVVPTGPERLLDGLFEVLPIGEEPGPAVENACLDFVDHPALQRVRRNLVAAADGRTAHVVAAIEVAAGLASPVGVALKAVAAAATLEQPVAGEQKR
ncbi:MAG TPA: hypothetical protein VNM14_12225 [Planctomycetota bacterium]|nr:hypothetical protein [Planctomycetota bacterium]